MMTAREALEDVVRFAEKRATVREIQSSPSRSPRSEDASAGREYVALANRLAGVAISSAECGRSVL